MPSRARVPQSWHCLLSALVHVWVKLPYLYFVALFIAAFYSIALCVHRYYELQTVLYSLSGFVTFTWRAFPTGRMSEESALGSWWVVPASQNAAAILVEC